MGTTAWIGIQNEDKSIRFIYCHYDGYVTGGVGEKLLKYYQNPETINKLLDLGDLSALGEKPIENLVAWDDNVRMTYLHYILTDPEKYHEGYVKQYPDDKCNCYKTRGDKNWQAAIATDEQSYFNDFTNTYNDYCYLFKDGEWFVREKGKDWRTVTFQLKYERTHDHAA